MRAVQLPGKYFSALFGGQVLEGEGQLERLPPAGPGWVGVGCGRSEFTKVNALR
jgi:hypothetical protein